MAQHKHDLHYHIEATAVGRFWSTSHTRKSPAGIFSKEIKYRFEDRWQSCNNSGSRQYKHMLKVFLEMRLTVVGPAVQWRRLVPYFS